MFDIGWSEMAVILAVALIVIGPKDLPKVARTVGRWTAKGRALAREFQNSLEEMAREAELDKVKSEIEKAGRVDPKRVIERTIDPKGEIGRAMDPAANGPADRPKAAVAAEPERAADGSEATPTATAPAPAGEQRASAPAAAGTEARAAPPSGAAAAEARPTAGEPAPERRTPRPEPVE